ncbi:hypothetical protein [Bdellovibrio sp.]|uniref:hypothetical protein n=1 Tax=Bdellovibrio sp. TaxID=28201 RepID=UPI0039E2FDC3
MKTRMHKFMFIFVVLFSMNALAGAPQELCQVSNKSSRLARDQRDEARMNCLKQKKALISVPQCLKIAKSMEYSTNAEDARLLCLYELGQQPTLKECFAISKSMEYADSGDEVRWECLRRFNKSITLKQCERITKDMSYPANTQRAEIYCAQELQ